MRSRGSYILSQILIRQFSLSVHTFANFDGQNLQQFCENYPKLFLPRYSYLLLIFLLSVNSYSYLFLFLYFFVVLFCNFPFMSMIFLLFYYFIFLKNFSKSQFLNFTFKITLSFSYHAILTFFWILSP